MIERLGLHPVLGAFQVGLILATVALEYQIVDQSIFFVLVIIALVTSMFSGPMMQKLIENKNLCCEEQTISVP